DCSWRKFRAEYCDSLDPFSEGNIFSVMPPKKSWKNISNLSGREKVRKVIQIKKLNHYNKTQLNLNKSRFNVRNKDMNKISDVTAAIFDDEKIVEQELKNYNDHELGLHQHQRPHRKTASPTTINTYRFDLDQNDDVLKEAYTYSNLGHNCPQQRSWAFSGGGWGDLNSTNNAWGQTDGFISNNEICRFVCKLLLNNNATSFNFSPLQNNTTSQRAIQTLLLGNNKVI
ncbi:7976_t:CDS:2, partial [Funneliformis geosporum]